MKKINFKGSVVLNPVPVVLITSRSKEGKDNVFTVGWTGTVCTKPPMLSISIRPERLSYEYIKDNMEFIVNLPTSKMVKAVDYCGVKSGKNIDKISEMNFTMKEGTHVDVAFIDECPVSIECKVKQIIPLGTHDIFIAEVLGSHINESLIDEKGKIHFEQGDLISYCHGEYYELPKESIGNFGFSVAKGIQVIRKKVNSENSKSKGNNSKSIRKNNNRKTKRKQLVKR